MCVARGLLEVGQERLKYNTSLIFSDHVKCDSRIHDVCRLSLNSAIFSRFLRTWITRKPRNRLGGFNFPLGDKEGSQQITLVQLIYESLGKAKT